MILLLDNYDSFTYNLYQFIAGVESKRGDMQKDQIDSEVKVIRNDQITPEKILELAPEALVISPGPGKPTRASTRPSSPRTTLTRWPPAGNL